jgi:hypothetical protein
MARKQANQMVRSPSVAQFPFVPNLRLSDVLLCFSLCGAGTFIASTTQKEDTPQKMKLIPVKNREVVRRVWIVT